jgi:protein O-GlcNAc transferase
MNRKQRRAEQKQGGDPSAAFSAAIQNHQAGRLGEAERFYRDVLKVDSRHAGAFHGLGILALQGGRFDAAADLIRKAIAQRDQEPAFHCSLGGALGGQGKFDEAIAAFARALTLKPAYPEAHFRLANVFREQGKLDEAVASYRRALTLHPGYVEALGNLANTLKCQGKLDEATASYRRVLALKPGFAGMHGNLGHALQDQGKLDEAIASYRRALALEPGLAGIHSDLGVVLRGRGKLDEAVASYRRALAIEPRFAEVYYNLGNALLDQGLPGEAAASFQQAIALVPAHADAHDNLLMTSNYQAGLSNAGLYETARKFDAVFDRRAASAKRPDNLDCGRRLRIGYVSGDFNYHPAGYFLSRVLPSHNRQCTEIFCYYNNTVIDDMTRRLRSTSDHWREIAGMPDADVDSLIRHDCIDILVDLSGHTGKNRLLLFALRPAPIQVSWLGYVATTGLAAMDYILMDAISAPPGDECFYSEALVRLPYGRFCYEAPAAAPPVVDPPCVKRGYVTFGSFNHIAKISAATVRLWADILEAVPASRLLLKWKSLSEESCRKRLIDAFAGAGISGDRLELRGYSPHHQMLAEYGDVDIALDPFPFAGGLTSCEALWMGVPVITLSGDRPAGRQTQGFLHQLGLDELAARTPADYAVRAAALARDLPQLTALRQSMRSRMLDAPLCDGPLFTAALESAFRDMWRCFCEGRDRVALDVAPL